MVKRTESRGSDAGFSDEAKMGMSKTMIEDVKRFIRGEWGRNGSLGLEKRNNRECSKAEIYNTSGRTSTGIRDL